MQLLKRWRKKEVRELSATAICQKLDRLAELEKERTDMQERLATDALTGLPNGRAMDIWLQDNTGWFVVCDLDGFKRINDTKGHAAGDRILVEFASFLRHSTRQGKGRIRDSFACRQHGDEFAIWCKNRNGARRIKNIIREWRSSIFGSVGASAGMGRDLESADQAMYRNKKGRKHAANI
jgi:diguanylate cyclase (GGDEF)-like protein